MEPERTLGNDYGQERTRPNLNLDQIIEWCDHTKKILSAVWLVGLTIGGVIFLIFYASIRFMPELDLQASLTFLIAAAISGIFIFIVLSVSLLYPGWVWATKIRRTDRRAILRKIWRTPDNEFSRGWASLYFALPMIGCAIIFPWGPYFLGSRWSLILILSLLWFVITSIIVYKNLPDEVTQYEGGNSLIIEPMRYKLLALRKKAILTIKPWWKWKSLLVFWKDIFLSMIYYFLSSLTMYAFVYTAKDPLFPGPLFSADATFALYIAIILISNAILATILLENLRQPSSWSWLPITFSLFIIFWIFIGLGQWALIPKTVMHYFKFGNIHRASLVLDKTGCGIVKHYDLKKKPMPIPNADAQCCLMDITIFSRLGAMYLINAEGNNRLSQFKITEKSLEDLKTKRVSDDILNNLEKIQNKEIIGEEEFLKYLEKNVGKEQTDKNKGLILEHAEKLPTKFDFTIPASHVLSLVTSAVLSGEQLCQPSPENKAN